MGRVYAVYFLEDQQKTFLWLWVQQPACCVESTKGRKLQNILSSDREAKILVYKLLQRQEKLERATDKSLTRR